LARVENSIGRALREGTGHPRAALGNYLAALDAASRQLESAPDNAIARRDYNFALARVFTLIRDARLEPWSKPLPVGDYTLVPPAVPPGRPEWSPDLYEFLPADQLVVRGTYVTKRIVKDGIGAPLVARRAEARADARAEFVMDRPYYGVTALARFEGNRCFLSFADPLAPEEVKVGSRKFPLAADYTAPLAVMLADTRPKKLELVRLLRPEKFAETAQITRLQPYAPKKTVVICVHGLMDSPATWIPLLNELRGDKEIRAHYQFWFYSYPSGYPYPYSAAIFRRELDAVEKKLQVRKPIVLIGHSMGGIIGRLMVTDSGDSIWLSLFGKKPAQTPLSNHARKLLTESLIFNHRPEVGRVIFIAAPHRGSHLASNWLGRLGSSLVKGPRTLVAMGKEIRHVLTLDVGALKMDRIPNSVDTLAPNNRFVKAINKVPLTCGIPYHTIAGDRGRGDTPNSSDGVVPYWSSHLEGAESELIVPSSHSAHQNPQAIQEVLRILKRHEQ
jgi:pimeloyl-ACP methyl ester carboxylesterase